MNGLPGISSPYEEKSSWFRDAFRPHFEKWVIEPGIKIMEVPEGKMPAFVWFTCAIEWTASLWWGESTDKNVGKAYCGFVNEFFPKGRYDAEHLYKSLRTGLVHLYTIKDSKYSLTDSKPQLHLRQTTSGDVVLNLEDFIDDFVIAKESFFNNVEQDSTLLDRVIKRINRDGFLTLIPIRLP